MHPQKHTPIFIQICMYIFNIDIHAHWKKAKHQWRVVSGPMAVLQTYLLEAGWHIEDPTERWKGGAFEREKSIHKKGRKAKYQAETKRGLPRARAAKAQEENGMWAAWLSWIGMSPTKC